MNRIHRFTLSVAFATGYVLGARAGRRRYEQIVVWWNGFVASPIVHRATERGKELLGQAGQTLSAQARARMASPRQLLELDLPRVMDA
jgi:hypothetical protein